MTPLDLPPVIKKPRVSSRSSKVKKDEGKEEKDLAQNPLNESQDDPEKKEEEEGKKGK